MSSTAPLRIAVVGAGPVGLSLAVHAARALPLAQISLFDARPIERDVGSDPRTLALSLGSVQWLQRLGCWPAGQAQAIAEVHVSQQAPSGWPGTSAEPELRIRARDEGVELLGAVLRYGHLVAPLQQAWLALAQREPQRLHTRFNARVAALKTIPEGVEIDAGIAEPFDLAVVAEGGVFAEQARPQWPEGISRDYHQTAWIGEVELSAGGAPGVAYERFTRHGPVALLPLPAPSGQRRVALVWCVDSRDDPVRDLSDEQRRLVLNTLLPACAGRIEAIGPLRDFALGLNARRQLVEGRTVTIGNAAQTLHPVAGQGFNLGLRDAIELVRALVDQPELASALRQLERRRTPDRWATVAATDALAQVFTWHAPGLGVARGLGLQALQKLAPLRSALARHMMFGQR